MTPESTPPSPDLLEAARAALAEMQWLVQAVAMQRQSHDDPAVLGAEKAYARLDAALASTPPPEAVKGGAAPTQAEAVPAPASDLEADFRTLHSALEGKKDALLAWRRIVVEARRLQDAQAEAVKADTGAPAPELAAVEAFVQRVARRAGEYWYRALDSGVAMAIKLAVEKELVAMRAAALTSQGAVQGTEGKG